MTSVARGGGLCAGLLLLIFANNGAAAAQTPASEAVPSANRNTSLIESFEILCARSTPDFDKIDALATAMNLTVEQSIDKRPAARSKSWIVTLSDGPHELVTAESFGPKGHIVNCGISAPDPAGAPFFADLQKKMRLGTPTFENFTATGRMVSWKGYFGPNTDLMFVDAEPAHKPGVMLFNDNTEPKAKR